MAEKKNMTTLTKTLQGGMIGAAAGMVIGFVTHQWTKSSGGSTKQNLPVHVPEVEDNDEALTLCLQLSDFRDYSNEAFLSVCKNMNQLLAFEKVVNDTATPIDPKLSKDAFSPIFAVKEALHGWKVPPAKQGDFDEIKEQVVKFVTEKQHNIMLGASARVDEEFRVVETT
jgi:hypothetical protein